MIFGDTCDPVIYWKVYDNILCFHGLNVFGLQSYRMGRKFRLHHKKKHYHPSSLVVSIPLSAISVLKVTIPLDALQAPEDDTTTLPVSLPLLLYTTGIVKSLDLLLGRILRAGLLPHYESLLSMIVLHYLENAVREVYLLPTEPQLIQLHACPD